MSTKASEKSYIDPTKTRLYLSESNNLCAAIDGRGEWEKVAVRLAFPYSDADHYVVLYHEEEEIGIIQDPGELDDESRRVLEQMVEKRYHIPAVQRIEDIEEIHNATRWIVETDRGERSFEVRDRHNFRRIGTGEIIVVDVDANRFRIPPRSALDEESQKLLDLYY